MMTKLATTCALDLAASLFSDTAAACDYDGLLGPHRLDPLSKARSPVFYGFAMPPPAQNKPQPKPQRAQNDDRPDDPALSENDAQVASNANNNARLK